MAVFLPPVNHAKDARLLSFLAARNIDLARFLDSALSGCGTLSLLALGALFSSPLHGSVCQHVYIRRALLFD